MDINYKIKQILVDKNITASHFADEIGVQRSSISHILAGRNRPSLDIIQKIIKRYPELGLDWILGDSNAGNLDNGPESSISSNYSNNKGAKGSDSSSLDFNRAKQPEQWDAPSNSRGSKKVVSQPKSIERILIFYTDGTFKDFTPGTE